MEVSPSSAQFLQTPVSRLIYGSVVGIGLVFGLLQIFASISQLFPQLSPNVRLSVFYGLQTIAIMTGGVLGGIGHRSGIWFGLGIGCCCGLLTFLAFSSGQFAALIGPFSSDLLGQANNGELTIAGQWRLFLVPLIHVVFGLIGGFVGGLLWQPPPNLAMPVLVEPKKDNEPKMNLETAAAASLFGTQVQVQREPLSWGRILFGIAVAVYGAGFAPADIRDFLVTFSGGELRIRTTQQNEATLGAIFVLSIFVGGTIAGAGTRVGLRQGLAVGIASLAVVVPLHTQSDLSSFLPLMVIGVPVLGALGGLFGSNLLPPPPPPKPTLGAVD